MRIVQTTTAPETAEDYVRFRRGIVKHLNNGSITWDEYSILSYLIVRANPKTGCLFTSYAALSDETQGKYSKNRINKILLQLKNLEYVYFEKHVGSGRSFELAINKYPLSGKPFAYLEILDDDDESKAELLVNRQNFEERVNGLVESKSMDFFSNSSRAPNNNNEELE